MRVLLIEAVDPEDRKLRLRKVLDFSRRHKKLSSSSGSSGAILRGVGAAHAYKYLRASSIVQKFNSPKGSQQRWSGDFDSKRWRRISKTARSHGYGG